LLVLNQKFSLPRWLCADQNPRHPADEGRHGLILCLFVGPHRRVQTGNYAVDDLAKPFLGLVGINDVFAGNSICRTNGGFTKARSANTASVIAAPEQAAHKG
jgi:hypothetical protein